MKIVVSDPVFLPEEYKKRLEALGSLTVYESMPESNDELITLTFSCVWNIQSHKVYKDF
jgi:hypothetical protein